MAPFLAPEPITLISESAKQKNQHPIDKLPEVWRPALLPLGQAKEPRNPETGSLISGWESAPLSNYSSQLLQKAPTLGLRLGSFSGGTLALDFDGHGAEAAFQATFGRPSGELPTSIAWTSGKPGRRQVALLVPEAHWVRLAERKRGIKDPESGDQLEFRWDYQQSAICGSHPETDGYRWVEGCAPWEIELATAPDWLLEGIPLKEKRERKEKRPSATPTGLVVPLLEMVSKSVKDLINNGSKEGHCNDDGLKVSIELIAVDTWLQAQGVEPDENIEDVYESYLDRCPDTIRGQPFDYEKAWARFNNALDKDWEPATPEEKLLKKLEYHKEEKRKRERNERLRNTKAFGGNKKDTSAPEEKGEETGEEQEEAGQSTKTWRVRLAVDEVMMRLPERIPGIRLNTRSRTVETANGELTADQIDRLYLQLSSESETWPKQVVSDAVMEHAHRNAYDPVGEYLEALTAEPLPMEAWQRLDRHLLGIQDPIAALFLPRYLIGAVARTFEPGCGVRQTPVIIGPQWRGKTALGRILFGAEHWVEGLHGRNEVDQRTRCHTAWGVELSELDGITRRADQESLKAFLTERVDVVRRAYGKGEERLPRRFVFWATSNGPPLRDPTGSTRFVCIPIPDRMLPLGWAVEHRDALWARAVEQYLSGVSWDATTEEERGSINDRNSNFEEIDAWSDAVHGHLATRRNSSDLPVQICDLFAALHIPVERQNNAATKRVRTLAELAGWKHERRRIAGKKLQGFWPNYDSQAQGEDLSDAGVSGQNDCGATDLRDADTSDTTGGGGDVSRQTLCGAGDLKDSDTPDTPIRPKLEKTKKGIGEEAEPPAGPAEGDFQNFGRFGVSGVSAAETPCKDNGSQGMTGVSAGVSGVPAAEVNKALERHDPRWDDFDTAFDDAP